MNNYSNENEPIHGLGELLFKATRTIYKAAGQLVLGAWDKLDTEACDRINNQQDMLDNERETD